MNDSVSNPVIIDGNSLIVRSIMATALDDLKAGQVWTGGVYGTLTSLASFLTQPEVRMRADQIIMFFDAGVPPGRLDCIPNYKAERKEKRKLLDDEDKEKAFQQLHSARKMLELLGVTCLAYRDREADDCVAAAVRIFAGRGVTPFVISGDRDVWQTVRMGARVWYLSKKAWIDAENFEDMAGVSLDHYVLYRALVGDASDSIAGVFGCGEKRAAALLQEYGDEFEALEPLEQFDKLVNFVARQKVKRKFEQALIEDAPRIADVIRGIDLNDSFGGTRGLCARMAERKSVDKMGFLRYAKRHQFNSVLGDPDRYINPFVSVARRKGNA